ncbi:MAG: T9SS type A sorting domain-containing protein [Bacteroidia bacterium]
MQKLTLSFLLLLMAWGQGLYAQGVTGTVTIANEKAVGTDYYFDLYLATRATTTGDIYLADADFRFTFDNTLFSSPTFQKRDSSVSISIFSFNIGYCSFVPTNDSPANSIVTQESYHTAMSLSMPGSDILSIEIPGSTPTDQTSLDDGVAKIDGTSVTHRLGRFYITGYNGTGNPSLTVSLAGLLTTQVFSYSNTQGFPSSAVDIEAASLPVEWLSFTAEKLNETTVQLNWVTASEINNDRFIIEKRLENGEFVSLDELDGAGFSETATYYEYQDRSQMASVVHYRLQQIDFDGTADFSDIVEVHFDELGAARYSVYPNPANDWLTIEALSERDQVHQYKMLDLRGKTVITGTLEANLGQTRVGVESLAAGTYILQIKNAKGQPINLKVTVE